MEGKIQELWTLSDMPLKNTHSPSVLCFLFAPRDVCNHLVRSFFFTHVQFAVRVPPKFVFKKKAIQTTNMVIWINLATTKKGLISNPWGFKVQTLNFCSLCRCLVFGVNFPCMQHATCSVTRL